jgi:hypothetical protein
MPGVYIIHNRVSGKAYIGQSYHCLRRLMQHWWQLQAGEHPNPNHVLQKDFKHFGEDAFQVAVIAPEPWREHEFINKYRTCDPCYGYNLQDAHGWNDESRQRDTERKLMRRRNFALLPGYSWMTQWTRCTLRVACGGEKRGGRSLIPATTQTRILNVRNEFPAGRIRFACESVCGT